MFNSGPSDGSSGKLAAGGRADQNRQKLTFGPGLSWLKVSPPWPEPGRWEKFWP